MIVGGPPFQRLYMTAFRELLCWLFLWHPSGIFGRPSQRHSRPQEYGYYRFFRG
jgi:hypothetical protein